MCIKILERHAVCRCTYYSHSVDACPAYGRRGHTVKTREVLVGYSCSKHSERPLKHSEPRLKQNDPDSGYASEESEFSRKFGPPKIPSPEDVKNSIGSGTREDLVVDNYQTIGSVHTVSKPIYIPSKGHASKRLQIAPKARDVGRKARKSGQMQPTNTTDTEIRSSSSSQSTEHKESPLARSSVHVSATGDHDLVVDGVSRSRNLSMHGSVPPLSDKEATDTCTHCSARFVGQTTIRRSNLQHHLRVQHGVNLRLRSLTSKSNVTFEPGQLNERTRHLRDIQNWTDPSASSKPALSIEKLLVFQQAYIAGAKWLDCTLERISADLYILYHVRFFGVAFILRMRYIPATKFAMSYWSCAVEKPPAKGKKRVRWLCRCGLTICDDFTEIRPGAAVDLERGLNAKRCGYRQHDPIESASRKSNDTSIGSTLGQTTSSSIYGSSSTLGFEGSAVPVQSQPPQRSTQDSLEAPPPALPDSLFLLLCIPHRNIANKLVHMDVRNLLSDQLFFSSLGNHYRSMRGKWTSVLSLSNLSAIRFVYFEMYPSTLVDIHKEHDIPPADRKEEYRYRPMPAEIIPPIGENHLMHLFNHPEDAEDSAICLDKVPKKLRERLGVCPQRGTGLGWGIHFVEGPNWRKLWLLGFLGFSMSITFGIGWAKIKHDTQGGFGIAACLMVGVTFTISILKAALEPGKPEKRS